MVDIIKNSLIPSIQKMYVNKNDAMIVEDNDTKHKCKKV